MADFEASFQLKQFSAIKARPGHIELTMLSYMCRHIKTDPAITNQKTNKKKTIKHTEDKQSEEKNKVKVLILSLQMIL